jgi:DNA-binding transcriptional LysR family regulator
MACTEVLPFFSAMELRQLRCFVALAGTLDVTLAARRLRTTPATLARRVDELESFLGCSLRRRQNSSRVVLTAAGHVFLERARQLLAAAESAAGEARQIARTAAERVRFGHFGALWADYYRPAFQRFLERFPGVQLHPVEATPADAVGALGRDEIDIALVGPADVAMQIGFATQPLPSVPALLVLGAGSPWAGKRRLKLAELREARWVAWDEHAFPGRKRMLIDAAARAGFTPRIVGEANGAAAVFAQVAKHKAVGYVQPLSRRLPHDGIKFAALNPAELAFDLTVIWRREAEHADRLETLAELLATTRPGKAG